MTKESVIVAVPNIQSKLNYSEKNIKKHDRVGKVKYSELYKSLGYDLRKQNISEESSFCPRK